MSIVVCASQSQALLGRDVLLLVDTSGQMCLVSLRLCVHTADSVGLSVTRDTVRSEVIQTGHSFCINCTAR